MASRTSAFLSPAQRAKLLAQVGGKAGRASAAEMQKGMQQLKTNKKKNENVINRSKQKKTAAAAAKASGKPFAAAAAAASTPCQVCLKDSDDARLLICDSCNGFFHTYCLAVPLNEVPTGDNWYCDACEHAQGDGMDHLVAALPPSYTSRFGEICWASGGPGYGWWPACIYDPRLTEPRTRLHARKYVGKRHLVYFFQCLDAPFDLLPNSKILSWEEGVAEGHYIGRTAKAAGRKRYVCFQEALQAAIIEAGKPISRRLDWTNRSPEDGGQAQSRFLPSPIQMPPASSSSLRKKKKKDKKKRGKHKDKHTKKRSRSRSRDDEDYDESGDGAAAACARRTINFGAPAAVAANVGAGRGSSNSGDIVAENQVKKKARAATTNANIEKAAATAALAAEDEDEDDPTELYCQVYLTEKIGDPGVCVGFVVLPSTTCTFADARKDITETLETEKFPSEWRFVHPSLGPVSIKLEAKLGSLITSLQRAAKGPRVCDIGTGTLDDPAKITIMADPLSK